jgi:small conductance mechanosensitive channel
METGLSFIDLYVTPWLGKLAIALIVFLIGKWVAEHLHKLLSRLLLKSKFDHTLVKFLGHVSYGFLMIAVVLTAVGTVGVNISSLLALIGAAGLAVGLALKDSLSNFAAGVMIIVFRPFKLGDSITASGQSGIVDEIGIFSTHLNTADNQRIIIPNSAVISGIIINATTLPQRRIDLIVSIGVDDSIGKVREVVTTVLAADARILSAPAPMIGVDKLTATTVDIFVRPWVQTGDYFAVRTDLLERLIIALGEAGIDIPARPAPIYWQQAPKD